MGNVVPLTHKKRALPPAPVGLPAVNLQPEPASNNYGDDGDNNNDGNAAFIPTRPNVHVGWSEPRTDSPGRLAGGGYCLQTQIDMSIGDYNIVYVSQSTLPIPTCTDIVHTLRMR
jgi:hypothetical protein